MSYQVLARKWRPRNLQEMVGQEHVLRMLSNALDNQRLHHAYLFTGTRGVGKTTLARILTKCLNCEKGISSTPCGECSICRSIDAGQFIDLIEIDAASRTKVEDTREILDNVQYTPSQGRYKIYLIDEVHMLSGHSFNALLKTLEEPPAHVKFLLATTDPKRLPITILSRCLQFNLKRVPIEQITQQLQHICQSENISFEETALPLIAQAADGSMRDALSLLDQTIAYCGEKISLLNTQQMLGNIEQDAIFRMLDSIAEQDGKTLLKEIAQLDESAPNYVQVLEEVLTILHQISIAQVVTDTQVNEPIKRFMNGFTAEEIQLFYQIALIGRRDLPLAPNPRQGFEMVMLRMLAFMPMGTTTETKQISPKQSAPAKPTSNVVPNSIVKPEPIPAKIEKSQTLSQATTAPLINENTDWATILTHLRLTGLAQALASNCTMEKLSNDKIELALSKTHEPMYNKKLAERIEQTLTDVFKKPMKLEIKITSNELNTPAKQQHEEKVTKQANAVEAIKNDTQVQKLMDMFGATLDVNSIETLS